MVNTDYQLFLIAQINEIIKALGGDPLNPFQYDNMQDFFSASLPWIKDNAGSGGGTVIWFSDTGSRDQYYIDNPTKLKQGVSCGVGDPVTVYTWDGNEWNTGALAFRGPKGDQGNGVPAGGTTKQVLSKKTNADGDTEWADPSGGGGGTTNYNDLSNKPKIDDVELEGNKTAGDLGLATAEDVTAAQEAAEAAQETASQVGENVQTRLQSKQNYDDGSWEWWKDESDGGGHWYWDSATSTLRFDGFNNDPSSPIIWEAYEINGGGPNFVTSGGTRIGRRSIYAWDGGAVGVGTLRFYITTGKNSSTFGAGDEVTTQAWVNAKLAGEVGIPLGSVATHADLLALTGMKTNDWVYVIDDTNGNDHVGETWSYAYDGTQWVELGRVNEQIIPEDDVTLEVAGGVRKVKDGGISSQQLADATATDAKIGSRTLADNAGADTLVSIAAKGLTAWLQGLRDNIKYLFAKADLKPVAPSLTSLLIADINANADIKPDNQIRNFYCLNNVAGANPAWTSQGAIHVKVRRNGTDIRLDCVELATGIVSTGITTGDTTTNLVWVNGGLPGDVATLSAYSVSQKGFTLGTGFVPGPADEGMYNLTWDFYDYTSGLNGRLHSSFYWDGTEFSRAVWSGDGVAAGIISAVQWYIANGGTLDKQLKLGLLTRYTSSIHFHGPLSLTKTKSGSDNVYVKQNIARGINEINYQNVLNDTTTNPIQIIALANGLELTTADGFPAATPTTVPSRVAPAGNTAHINAFLLPASALAANQYQAAILTVPMGLRPKQAQVVGCVGSITGSGGNPVKGIMHGRININGTIDVWFGAATIITDTLAINFSYILN